MQNPYQSPEAVDAPCPTQRKWKGGADAVLLTRGLLQRKIVVNRPVEVTIEYFARGLRDRIIVDGKTVVSVVPILWLKDSFEFEIPFANGVLPAKVSVKTGRGTLAIVYFAVEIDGVIAYEERNGVQLASSD